MSRVSIIIPCHNDGIYLLEALACAKAQTHSDLEIIVANDYSQDAATVEILENLKQDAAIRVLDNNGTPGPASARNSAIKNSTGDYILPLDADDRVAPSYAAKAAEVLDSNPAVGICYCQAKYFGLKKGNWELPPFSLAEIMLGNMIFTSAMFRRSDWLAVGGYDETVSDVPEDHLLWLALLNTGVGVWRIPEVLFFYRIRPNSRTTQILSTPQKRLNSALTTFKAREDFYHKHLQALYLKALELYHTDLEHKKLFSYKLLRPLFALENKARAIMKKIIGRAH